MYIRRRFEKNQNEFLILACSQTPPSLTAVENLSRNKQICYISATVINWGAKCKIDNG